MKIKHIFTPLVLLIFAVGGFSQDTTRNHTVFSKSIGEDRVITMGVPSGYEKSGKRYPVIYVLDGEWVFDFANSSVSHLSDFSGRIPQMIVVGIPNTDRTRDLFVTLNSKDGYGRFLDFLEKELIPFVNKNYRTNGFNAIYGFSSGAGICMQLLATRPNLFDAYIESGSGIGPKTRGFLAEKIPKQTYKNKYLFVSTEGIGPRVPGLKRYEELLGELNPKGLKRKFVVFEGLKHADILSEGLNAGLKFVFSDYAIPDSITKKGADKIIEYFKEINKNYNFDVEIPVGIINEAASLLAGENKLDEAIKLVLHGMKIYPESSVLYGTLAELYEFKKEPETALKYYKTAYEKVSDNQMLYLKYRAMYQKLKKERDQNLSP
jgi:enterochelin esterase-like enzyme